MAIAATTKSTISPQYSFLGHKGVNWANADHGADIPDQRATRSNEAPCLTEVRSREFFYENNRGC